MNRQRMLAALESEDRPWDIVVIGGGATGLGIAVEAATRGHRVALVEAHDFAHGTSSRSTKLIHGGVRYLRQGQVNMVRQSLHERGRLQRNAPHIVHPRRFVIPAYHFASRVYFYAGMKAYDLLAGQLGFEASRLLSKSETLAALPTLQSHGLRGGVAFTDGQFDDARLAIALAQTAVEHGGVVINYAPVVRLLAQGSRLSGAVICDIESGREISLRGRVVINATGVFGETIMQLDSGLVPGTKDQASPHIVPSQGAHLVLPRDFLPSDAAMLIPHTDDSRVLFAIPWHGATLLGTTDHRVEHVELEPRPLPSEIDYLLEHAGRYLTRRPERSDILSVFAGLRPLVGASPRPGSSTPTSTAALSREHEIHTSSSGLISIIGGKWTTYRKMGEDVVDLAERVGELPHVASQTASLRLHAAPSATANWSAPAAEPPGIEDPLRMYGTQRNEVLALSESEVEYAQRLAPGLPYIAAQVAWSVEHEMARNVDDVLSRRLRALLLDARASLQAAPAVAALMQRLLQRDAQWRESQLAAYTNLVNGYLPM